MSIPPEEDDHCSYPAQIAPGETIDHILGGRLKILQNDRGYRFSLDSLLLAGFVQTMKDNCIIDLGTGSGVIALALAQKSAVNRVVGIDIQGELTALARRSVVLNNLMDKVEIIQGDIREVKGLVAPETFEIAVFNPPYRPLGSGRVNPKRQKAIARHEIKATLPDFLNAARFVLKQSGRVYAIYPASRMIELLCQMRAHDLEPKKIRLVHSRYDSSGQFVLVEGVKGGKEELEVLPPLTIYQSDGAYSETMTRFFLDMGRT